MEASLPVDKAFSLYPIFASLVPWLLAADYSKSEHQVYHETAVALMEAHKSLDLLYFVPGIQEGNLFSPSWVPNLAIPVRKPFREPLKGGNRHPRFYFSEDKKVLHIYGVVADVVRAVAREQGSTKAMFGQPIKQKWSIEEKERAFRVILTWYKLARSLKSPHADAAFQFFAVVDEGLTISAINLAELFMNLSHSTPGDVGTSIFDSRIQDRDKDWVSAQPREWNL